MLSEGSGWTQTFISALVQAGNIFEAVMWPRSWFRCWPMWGFRCVVMDDRGGVYQSQVFLAGRGPWWGIWKHISECVDIRSRDYVCVMTRGHQFDYYVQKQAMAPASLLHRNHGKQGNKIRVVTDKLLADSFSLEEIKSAICLSVRT